MQVDGQTTPPGTAQPAPLSSADIRRYQRRLEEGYDLPDPWYLQWKDSTMGALPERMSSWQMQTPWSPTVDRVRCLPEMVPLSLCRNTPKEGRSCKLHLFWVFVGILNRVTTILVLGSISCINFASILFVATVLLHPIYDDPNLFGSPQPRSLIARRFHSKRWLWPRLECVRLPIKSIWTYICTLQRTVCNPKLHDVGPK